MLSVTCLVKIYLMKWEEITHHFAQKKGNQWGKEFAQETACNSSLCKQGNLVSICLLFA